MAYTYDQIIKAYTALHVGKAPDAATAESLILTASMNASGQLSDSKVMSILLNGADSTTAVAVLTYQFFTGKSPTANGLTYLVNSPVNTADLNDGYYTKFNLENRYINFAANLGLYGEGATAFANKYGAMDFSAYVASIYQTIIGRSYAEAAGINVDAAIAYLVSTKDAVLQTVRDAGMITPNSTAAQIDLALKAAMSGLVMAAAIKADVGLYAAATDNFMIALAQGTATYNTDITQTYRPSFDTPAHGTGQAADRGPTSLPDPVTTTPVTPPPPASHIYTLTSGVNHLTGTAQDDTFNATSATLTAGDTLDGRGGDDELNVTTTGSYFMGAVTVTGIETVNFASSGFLQATNWTGWTGVDVLSLFFTGGAYANVQNVPTTIEFDITGSLADDSAHNFLGGGDIYADVTMGPGAWNTGITVGRNDGETHVSRTNTGAGDHGFITVDHSAGDIYVGQIANTAGIANGDTQNTGDVAVYGGANTSYVQVLSTAPVAATGGTVGVRGGAVNIYDYQTYTGGSNILGSIGTVYIDGFRSASTYGVYIVSNVLSDLTLAHGSGTVSIGNYTTAAGYPTTLDLTVVALDDVLLREDGFYATINIDTGTTTSTLTGIESTLTTLNVNGDGALILSAPNTNTSASGLHQINVNDTASLTATFGAGNDTFNLGAGASVIDTGAGADLVNIVEASGTSDVTYSTLTMSAGDVLRITPQAGAVSVNGALGAAATGATFRDLLDSAASGDGHVNSQWGWFNFGGDTYIVLDSSADNTFQAGTDIVVKLAGVLDETGASISLNELTLV